MQRYFTPLTRRTQKDYLRYLLLAITALVVTAVIPKTVRFKYSYTVSKPWQYDNLQAPFDYPIKKSAEELKKDKTTAAATVAPYYRKSPEVIDEVRTTFSSSLEKALNEANIDKPAVRQRYRAEGQELINEVYANGVIQLDSGEEAAPPQTLIQVVSNNTQNKLPIAAFLSRIDAVERVQAYVAEDTFLNKSYFLKAMLDAIKPNVVPDTELSQRRREEEQAKVAETHGAVQENELIVAKGQRVTEDIERKLTSLKELYEQEHNNQWVLFLGYFYIVAVLILIYGINLEVFSEVAIRRARAMLLICGSIILFSSITSFVVKSEQVSIYIIPYCIVPIVLMAFFGSRVAIVTHILLVLICGLMVPNAYEFVLIQTLAGFTGVLSMANIRYISQFFLSVFLIFITYCFSYLALDLLQVSEVSQLDLVDYSWFGANFILTLLAYLIIYGCEKLLGFLSDISLLELSDINNKLLKELFMRAPGTFQHSLQVANLAEAVIDRIGGNPLLTRVGALYHDIGKMDNPEYFIENLKGSLNPHENISDMESTELIIGHVQKGVEIAEENRLPTKVVDFIRTHHGTTRVEYFYKHYLSEHADEKVDEGKFRYPGPKPSTKEEAVVMISDSVEAASRAMKELNEEKIEKLVDNIIDGKLRDNQFEFATITIHDINTSRRVLKNLLKSIYHVRVQYPQDSPARQLAGTLEGSNQ